MNKMVPLPEKKDNKVLKNEGGAEHIINLFTAKPLEDKPKPKDGYKTNTEFYAELKRSLRMIDYKSSPDILRLSQIVDKIITRLENNEYELSQR